jgi:hypothetical protein
MLLKQRRARLPRTEQASWPGVTLALLAVLAGLVGNVILDPGNVEVFSIYFLIAGAAVAVMFVRRDILRIVLVVSSRVVERVRAANERIRSEVVGRLDEINRLGVIYFTKGDDPAVLNRAALYVLTNEQTSLMRVVHVYERENEIPAGLAEQLSAIDHLYPSLRIDFLAVKGTFGPALIESLARRLRVPKNLMFIGTPGDRFPHRLSELGGVRVIL